MATFRTRRRRKSIGNGRWGKGTRLGKIQTCTLANIHLDCTAKNLQRQSLTGHTVAPKKGGYLVEKRRMKNTGQANCNVHHPNFLVRKVVYLSILVQIVYYGPIFSISRLTKDLSFIFQSLNPITKYGIFIQRLHIKPNLSKAKGALSNSIYYYFVSKYKENVKDYFKETNASSKLDIYRQ